MAIIGFIDIQMNFIYLYWQAIKTGQNLMISGYQNIPHSIQSIMEG